VEKRIITFILPQIQQISMIKQLNNTMSKRPMCSKAKSDLEQLCQMKVLRKVSRKEEKNERPKTDRE
jgi:hypothetical protein